jgi:rhodanese-related sulfurtransferase
MTDFLTSAGFDAYSVAGGTSGWARSGRAVVTGPAPGA